MLFVMLWKSLHFSHVLEATGCRSTGYLPLTCWFQRLTKKNKEENSVVNLWNQHMSGRKIACVERRVAAQATGSGEHNKKRKRNKGSAHNQTEEKHNRGLTPFPFQFFVVVQQNLWVVQRQTKCVSFSLKKICRWTTCRDTLI